MKRLLSVTYVLMSSMQLYIMYFRLYPCLAYFVVSLLPLSTNSKNLLEEGLRKYDVIPKVLPKAPKEICKVRYYWGDLVLGAQLDKISVTFRPDVEWTVKNDSARYTLYLVAYVKEHYTPHRLDYDPEWYQWVVVDILGSGGIPILYGRELYPYAGSWGAVRPNTTDVYTFLIYKQRATFQEMGVDLGDRFMHLGPLRHFVANFSLGDPVCGNYYTMSR